jgi:hypothetical protein
MGFALSFLGEYANMILMRCGALHHDNGSTHFVDLASIKAKDNCVHIHYRVKPVA